MQNYAVIVYESVKIDGTANPNTLFYWKEGQIPKSKIDLIRETAKVFGFTRVGCVVEISTENAIQEAVKRGYIKVSEDGKKVSITE